MGKTLKLIVLTLFVSVVLITGTGCALFDTMSAEDRQNWNTYIDGQEKARNVAMVSIEKLQEHERELDSLIQLAPNDELREKLQKAKDTTLSEIQKNEAMIIQVNAEIAKAEDAIRNSETNADGIASTIEAIGGVAGTIAPATGPAAPFVLIGGLVATMVAGIMRAIGKGQGKKETTMKFASNLETVKSDGVIDFTDYATSDQFKRLLTPQERRWIAEARGKI